MDTVLRLINVRDRWDLRQIQQNSQSKTDITFTKVYQRNDGKAERLFQAQREVKLQECTLIGVSPSGLSSLESTLGTGKIKRESEREFQI